MSELGYGTGIAEAAAGSAAAGGDSFDGEASAGAGYEGTLEALAAEDGLPPRQEVSDVTWSDTPEWDEADLAGGYDGDVGALTAEERLPPRQEVSDTAWHDSPEWDETDLADEYDGDLDALTAEENSPARPDAQGNASAPDQSADGRGDSPERDGVSPSIADRKNSSESTDLVDAKPARLRGIVSASNVAITGALIDVYDTVAKFPAHATPLEVAIPMAATILGLSAWGLDKIEKHKKGKR